MQSARTKCLSSPFLCFKEHYSNRSTLTSVLFNKIPKHHKRRVGGSPTKAKYYNIKSHLSNTKIEFCLHRAHPRREYGHCATDPLRSDYSPAPMQPSLWLGSIDDSVVRRRCAKSEDTGEGRATSEGGFRDLSCLTAGLQPCLPSKPGPQARKSGKRLKMNIFGQKKAPDM